MDDDAAVAAMSGADLQQMRARRDDTHRLLLAIRHRINREAEDMVKNSHSLLHTHGRHSTSWTRSHERAFRTWQGQGLSDHRREIGALEAKLRRQNAAIAQYHLARASK